MVNGNCQSIVDYLEVNLEFNFRMFYFLYSIADSLVSIDSHSDTMLLLFLYSLTTNNLVEVLMTIWSVLTIFICEFWMYVAFTYLFVYLSLRNVAKGRRVADIDCISDILLMDMSWIDRKHTITNIMLISNSATDTSGVYIHGFMVYSKCHI